MTLEEEAAAASAPLCPKRMEAKVGQALERLLAAAQAQRCLTLGVYEAAKLMNADPDSVVLCLLAIDEEDEDDIALQIHFTLIQAFCCNNDIDILRISGMERLAAVLGESGAQPGTPNANTNANPAGEAEPKDLHCILVTNPHTEGWKSQGLAEVASYCEDCRGNNQWVPYVSLQAR
ncbi:growth arrest and DNA damage-inducible protein GADD45 beta [Sceloporus undulatus]|uniref:growth arrest and DNA damage-inducible protein GADD45 beta n=1 Tax=Sceloporus undulatus TaxID=8520 RepID=UPI001C4C2651|nr:growth arrest and DNA damage-inducible protein GADD45 beta [Sceloporus undulatus]